MNNRDKHFEELFSNHKGLTLEEIDLLRERTESLGEASKKICDSEEEADDERYLIVSYLDERYGVPLDAVSEVIGVSDIVVLPGSPPHIMGLTRLRGQILALVNLHVFWRNRVAGHSDCDQAVIVQAGEVCFGLACNKIEGLKAVASAGIEKTPADLPPLTKDTVRGIADRNILLIDPAALVSAPGFIVG